MGEVAPTCKLAIFHVRQDGRGDLDRSRAFLVQILY